MKIELINKYSVSLLKRKLAVFIILFDLYWRREIGLLKNSSWAKRFKTELGPNINCPSTIARSGYLVLRSPSTQPRKP